MTRNEMITEFNFYVRKRNCYVTKIEVNNALKTTLRDGLSNCNTYTGEIESYADDAVIFQQLYDKNYDYFNAAENQRLLGILDDVGTHLEDVINRTQQSINYWQAEIDAHDAEQ